MEAFINLRQRLMRIMFRISVGCGANSYQQIDLDLLNQFITEQLPIKQSIDVPVGEGELLVSQANVKVTGNKLSITAHCYLNIHTMNTSLYQASIKITISGDLGFCQNNQFIQLQAPQLETLELEDDHYPIATNTTSWVSRVLSGDTTSRMFSGFENTLSFISGQTYDEAKRYLSIYINGNKQKILDYHRPDIQLALESLFSEPEHCYKLDPDNFEESLLIEHGRSIKAEQGQLRIYWS